MKMFSVRYVLYNMEYSCWGCIVHLYMIHEGNNVRTYTLKFWVVFLYSSVTSRIV